MEFAGLYTHHHTLIHFMLLQLLPLKGDKRKSRKIITTKLLRLLGKKRRGNNSLISHVEHEICCLKLNAGSKSIVDKVGRNNPTHTKSSRMQGKLHTRVLSPRRRKSINQLSYQISARELNQSVYLQKPISYLNHTS
jgi:hypothetical protein